MPMQLYGASHWLQICLRCPTRCIVLASVIKARFSTLRGHLHSLVPVDSKQFEGLAVSLGYPMVTVIALRSWVGSPHATEPSAVAFVAGLHLVHSDTTACSTSALHWAHAAAGPSS